ncbi:MAG: sigma-70 family RNA polymerase sigma factor [Bacteroidetes bacterium]|nr:sigma-70 family RNA polymerase sigma factor [Bacteroidota bacterium]
MAICKVDIEWSRLKAGDVKALESIYLAYVGSMLSYGLKITADIDLVRDSIQDLFIELWKSRENLADIVQPKFYLFRALRNKLSRSLSRQSFVSEAEMQLSFDSQSTAYVELEIAIREEEAEVRSSLSQVIDKLPRRQQEVIYLRFYQDFSYETIAVMMEMNYQSVLNLAQRALKSLRSAYAVNNSGR